MSQLRGFHRYVYDAPWEKADEHFITAEFREGRQSPSNPNPFDVTWSFVVCGHTPQTRATYRNVRIDTSSVLSRKPSAEAGSTGSTPRRLAPYVVDRLRSPIMTDITSAWIMTLESALSTTSTAVVLVWFTLPTSRKSRFRWQRGQVPWFLGTFSATQFLPRIAASPTSMLLGPSSSSSSSSINSPHALCSTPSSSPTTPLNWNATRVIYPNSRRAIDIHHTPLIKRAKPADRTITPLPTSTTTSSLVQPTDCSNCVCTTTATTTEEPTSVLSSCSPTTTSSQVTRSTRSSSLPSLTSSSTHHSTSSHTSSSTISSNAPTPTSFSASQSTPASATTVVTVFSTTTLSLPLETPKTSQTMISVSITTLTHLTTVSWSTIVHGSSTHTVIETGTLSPSDPGANDGFSRNTRAIIGIAVAGTVAVIICVFVIFFTCTRFRTKKHQKSGSDDLPRWHPPLAGDDESQNYVPHPIASASRTSEMTRNTTAGPEHIAVPPARLSTSDRTCIDPHQLQRPSMSRSLVNSESALISPPQSRNKGEPDSGSQERIAPKHSTHNNADQLEKPFDETLVSLHEAGQREQQPIREGHVSHLIVPNSVYSPTLGDQPAHKPAHTTNNRSIDRPNSKTWPSAWDSVPPIPDDSPMLEGLLTPHLSAFRSGQQSSPASLRDDEDYSRPIGGPVRNRLHSGTTYRTYDAEL